MDFFELIGLLLMLLFLLSPLLRRLFGRKKRAAPLPSIKPPVVEKVIRPSPPPPKEAQRPLHEVGEFHPALEEYAGMEATGAPSFKPTIGLEMGSRYGEDAAYKSAGAGTSRIAQLLRRPGGAREMVLLSEVISRRL
ncbi:MAG: hypothetical protein AB7F31_04535 [Parachlamydiales bacterium]